MSFLLNVKCPRNPQFSFNSPILLNFIFYIHIRSLHRVSANAPKPFINLEFAKRKLPSSFLGNTCTRLPNYGLLFSYFNNPRAFNDYVRYFIGNFLIMIGPSLKTPAEKHIDPMPEAPDFETPKLWIKAWSKEIGCNKDICVIWKRNL